jgi:hypothetical protein
MTRPPLDCISYQLAANALRGARTADIPCPLCGPLHKGASAQRRVLRTWAIGGGSISLHCARCGVEGWVAPDGHSAAVRPPPTAEVDEERQRRPNAELVDRIWRQAGPIAGSPGASYFRGRGIDIEQLPDFGGLRWHPRCPWEGGTACCIIARFTDAITAEPRGIWRRPIGRGHKPRTLGPMKRCVIRLWPDEAVTTGLVLGEGVETVLAASQIEFRGTLLQPTWAAGCAGNMAHFPVLAGIEALTLLVDNDRSGAGQAAAAQCGRRWFDAGREVIRLTPEAIGADFNDIIRTESAA